MSRRKLTDAQVTVLALLAGGGHLIESGRYVCVRPRGLWVCHRQTFNALRARSLIHQAVKKNPSSRMDHHKPGPARAGRAPGQREGAEAVTHTPDELEAAHLAGHDAATKFPSPRNCSFRFFATRELRDAWQRGHDEGLAQRRKETA